ncbi:MAG: hypothetical protein EAZ95_02740 [Bacteroidetes bacterium]|nr:MAG: hypothetical protein EAZ95_02740 [Bacteroidota bacterium]
MKKLLFIGALCFCASFVQAQGFYLKAGVGYSTTSQRTMLNTGIGNRIYGYSSTNYSYTGFGATGYHLNTSYNTTQQGGSNIISIKQLTGSYATGANFQVGAGYMFTPNIGVELNAEYTAGKEVSISAIKDFNGSRFIDVLVTGQSNTFLLSPSLVLSAGGNGRLKPYTRLGVLLNFGGKLHSTNVSKGVYYPLPSPPYPLSSGTVDIDAKATTKFNMGIGFTGAIGTDIKIKDKINVFAELFFNYLELSAKNSQITEAKTLYKINNIPQGEIAFADLKTFQKEINYVKELTASSNNADYISAGQPSSINMDKPKDELGFYSNFSAMGIRLGVKYHF